MPHVNGYRFGLGDDALKPYKKAISGLLRHGRRRLFRCRGANVRASIEICDGSARDETPVVYRAA